MLPAMPGLPFALRRPALLVRDLLADRERPDLEALGAIVDPERFCWAILPHAARTFSACIALLPAPSARAAAVAYLYCRILDTYEDLSPGPDAAVASLEAFSERFEQVRAQARPAQLPAPPPIDDGKALDARDRAHLLLVRRTLLVDAVFLTLPLPVQAIIADLVAEMAAGMAWAAREFHQQGGVLADDDQLQRYCRAVLGEPVRFVARMTLLRQGGSAQLSPQQHEVAMRAGEFVQLANVTRDVEKDLARGVAFRPALTPWLGQAAAGLDGPGLCAVRDARSQLLDLALVRAADWGRLTDMLDTGQFSLTRGSCLLMLLFTERYYGGCAERVGRPRAGRRKGGLQLLLATAAGVLFRGVSASLQRRALFRLSRLQDSGERSPS